MPRLARYVRGSVVAQLLALALVCAMVANLAVVLASPARLGSGTTFSVVRVGESMYLVGTRTSGVMSDLQVEPCDWVKYPGIDLEGVLTPGPTPPRPTKVEIRELDDRREACSPLLAECIALIDRQAQTEFVQMRVWTGGFPLRSWAVARNTAVPADSAASFSVAGGVVNGVVLTLVALALWRLGVGTRRVWWRVRAARARSPEHVPA